MLADEITQDLCAIQSAALADAKSQGGKPVTCALTSKGISYGSLTAQPDGKFDKSAVLGVNADLRVRPFFAEGSTMSIREFIVVGAYYAEMGLESPDEDLLAAATGTDVITPAGMLLSGSIDDIESPPVGSEGEDGDGDGIVNEVPTAIVDHLEFYLLKLLQAWVARRKHARRQRPAPTCCHQQRAAAVHSHRLRGLPRARLADRPRPPCRRCGDGVHPGEAGFNHLFATAVPRFDTVDDDSGFPTLKNPQRQPFLVRNIFADFKRHDLGPNFHERDFTVT